MVQHSEAAAGAKPTEQSPLLDNNQGTSNGTDFGSITSEPPANLPINENDIAKSPSVEEDGSISQAETEAGLDRGQVAKIISVMLIGILVANADGSILMATHPVIASEFDELSASSWLITSFSLAGAATQTLYGKLSDIYGRKWLVIGAYSIFALGCVIISVGQSMWQVVLGRIISGMGASGMTTLVSVLITDLLPLREVAQWRAFVNIVATTGRSVGGPLGGWLADAIGWRWSFLGQVPIIGVAIVLCAIYLPGAPPSSGDEATADSNDDGSTTRKSKFGRIDFKGSFIFAIMILALLFPMELGGVQFPWSHPLIISLFFASVALVALFIFVEQRQAEPILPLEIFHSRDAVLSYIIMGLQSAAQIGLMFTVPLYFKVTSGSSNTVSGAHLVPAVVGNAVGGVLSGLLIKRFGRYKSLIIFATLSSALGYLLLMFTWHGNTGWWESLYIAPGGFGMGVAQSAVFISLQAVVAHPSHMAPAIAFMYLSSTVCFTIGLAVVNAVLQSTLRAYLESRLLVLGLSAFEIQRIIASTISDVDFVKHTTGDIRKAVVDSYIDGLYWTHVVSLISSSIAFVLAISLKQRRIDGTK
ncbi:major facilitator superfamily-domain-containing protein [Podospora didyma]|uniref:Major facilitator superfamily-domain-containing protein n=1 Tax=Podospora didyma TaxID=330526 RepID=A0AAE0K0N5_9PEZI|nr:major facilitator superfamily-domain-containing protein [Podospora didyma]